MVWAGKAFGHIHSDQFLLVKNLPQMVLLKMGHPFKMLERISAFSTELLGEMYGHGGQIYSIFCSPKMGHSNCWGSKDWRFSCEKTPVPFPVVKSAGLKNLGILEVFFAKKQWLFLVPIKGGR